MLNLCITSIHYVLYLPVAIKTSSNDTFIYLLQFMAYNQKGKIKKPRDEMQKHLRPQIKAGHCLK